MKKFLREGGKSPADLTSENFKSLPTNLKPELKKVETMPVPENKIIINQTQYITVIDNSVKINGKKEEIVVDK